MLKNMTASEIKRMTTDGKTAIKKINSEKDYLWCKQVYFFFFFDPQFICLFPILL